MKSVSDLYAKILAQPGVEGKPPASVSDIEDAEQRFGFSLPDELKSLFALSNGAVITKDFSMVSLQVSVEYSDLYRSLKLVALTDENNSDPYCYVCASPLCGSIIHLQHDGPSTLRFSSLKSFLLGIQLIGTEELYRHSDRNTDCQKLCLETLEWVESLEENDNSRFLALAVSFEGLGEGHEDVLGRYLTDEDMCVREAALERLNKLQTARAKKIVHDDSIAYERFVADAAAVLASVGIETCDHRQIGSPVTLRLKPSNTGLNMMVFYTRRNDPNIFQEIIERARYFLRQSRR